MIRVAWDLDMTMNNMAFMWAKWLRENIDPKFDLSMIRYFGWVHDAYGAEGDAYWKDPYCYEEIQPFDEIVEVFHMYDSFIVTHTPPGQRKEIKDYWIRKHIGDVEVVHSGEKYEHTRGCVHVDDHPGHIQRHVRNHPECHGIVYNHMNLYNWAKPLLTHDHVWAAIHPTAVKNLLDRLGVPRR